ncbi:SRPBCC family protein [Lacihabitans lacunae]|uniref:Cell division protein n=1 Tax=Lacihabitans lacunae TaxID=1028214 RepID=A0ABV7Z026_9BACT
MPRIFLETEINNTKEVVFDLARSIDLHKDSTKKTNERVVEGRDSGLLELNEEITWRAKHLGVYQNLKVKITELEFPYFFCDEMVSGAFKSFKHTHKFQDIDGRTLMTDIFEYKSPLGFLGRIADFVFLEKYMKKFLLIRNQVIKAYAESKNKV